VPRTAVKPEVRGQVAGYWFGPGERVPRKPVGLPTGALLPARGSSVADDELLCLDLVPFQHFWIPLSEAGRYTYRHSSGILFDTQPWLFVPVPEATGGRWPVKFLVSYGTPLERAAVEERYGKEVARRARPDVPAVQLRLKIQRRPAVG
jgi:hypothetical protein